MATEVISREKLLNLHDPYYCPSCETSNKHRYSEALDYLECRGCGRVSYGCHLCGRLAAHGYHDVIIRRGEITICDVCAEKPHQEDRIVEPRHHPRCLWCEKPSCFERYGLDYEGQCKDCSTSMVSTYEEYAEALEDVVEYCRLELGLEVALEYRLILADSEEIMRRAGKRAMGLWMRSQCEMVISNQLPECILVGVLAHEHTHAWQETHCPPQSKQLEEGLASWVEMKVMEELGYHQIARRMLNKRCLFYGEGLRVLLKMERELGVQGTLRKVTTLTDLEDKYQPRRPRKAEPDGSYLA